MPPLIGRPDLYPPAGGWPVRVPLCDQLRGTRGWVCRLDAGHEPPCAPRPAWWNVRAWLGAFRP